LTGQRAARILKATPRFNQRIWESKLAGERAVEQAGGAYLILRTSWVYSLRRDSFVTKVLDWAASTRFARCRRSGWQPNLGTPAGEASAQALAKGARGGCWIGERRGLYHLAGDGVASRLEWRRPFCVSTAARRTGNA